ncbi:MAG: RluA family pseudouridine synthase [Odoribacteraceae bacterium]|nr:RluA family pseudouridine synthase [Odoribacteraceae bacterium]
MKARNSADRERAPRVREFTVGEESGLLAYLFLALPDKSRSTVKSILSGRQVFVNDAVTTRFDAPLRPGDRVRVNMEKGVMAFSHPELEIVYEDEALIVINKRQGLLSVATGRERQKTAYYILTDYVRRLHPGNRVFVLHRLDRETSGLMMFAKSERVQEEMQRHWDEMVTCRKYVAVVEGKPARESDRIVSRLQENSAMNVYSAGEGQLAVTRYTMLKTNRLYSLLELELETGRKNQIRVHAAEMGHPVAGDAKYGARSNPINRLALHARELHFIHPVTRELMHFQTEIPKRFLLLVKQRERRDV